MHLMRSLCRRKKSVEDETHENIDSVFDEDNLYDLDKIRHDGKE